MPRRPKPDGQRGVVVSATVGAEVKLWLARKAAAEDRNISKVIERILKAAMAAEQGASH